MLLSCPAMLDIKGSSITSKVFHNLVDAYTRPLYMSCVQNKFKWEDTTVKSIAWISLSLALNRIDRPALTTHTCPICTTSEETSKHLLQCNHERRVEWRRKLVKDLGRTLTNKNTRYAVIETLLATAVTEWLDTGQRGVYTTIPEVIYECSPISNRYQMATSVQWQT